jgi:hypothetical protein
MVSRNQIVAAVQIILVIFLILSCSPILQGVYGSSDEFVDIALLVLSGVFFATTVVSFIAQRKAMKENKTNPWYQLYFVPFFLTYMTAFGTLSAKALGKSSVSDSIGIKYTMPIMVIVQYLLPLVLSAGAKNLGVVNASALALTEVSQVKLIKMSSKK